MQKIILDVNNYIIYRETPWDSKVFGYNTNEIIEFVYSDENQLYKLIEKHEEICVTQKYLFTNTRIAPDDKILRKVLNDLGYFNAETSLFVELNTKNITFDESINKLKFSTKKINAEDIQNIEDMASTIFHHGRFFEDPYISIENAKRRNENWIDDLKNSSDIIIGEKNSVPFAFMALKINDDIATLLLGGVKENFKFLAYPFWLRIFLELINKHKIKKIVSVISASNIPIINIYFYFGFKVTKCFFGYHKHRGALINKSLVDINNTEL